MRWIPILLAACLLTLVVPATPASAECVGVHRNGQNVAEACSDFQCDGVYVGAQEQFHGTCQEPGCNVIYYKSNEVERLCWI